MMGAGNVNINIDTITGDVNIQQICGNIAGNAAGQDNISGNKDQRSISASRDYHERIEGDA